MVKKLIPSIVKWTLVCLILYTPVFLGTFWFPIGCACPRGVEICGEGNIIFLYRAFIYGPLIFLLLIPIFLYFKNFLLKKCQKMIYSIGFDIFFSLLFGGVLAIFLRPNNLLWLLPINLSITLFLVKYLFRKHHKRFVDIELALIFSGILFILIGLWYWIYCEFQLF